MLCVLLNDWIFVALAAGCRDEQYRQHLGSYGVSGELATRPIVTLSGGQKSRVAFAVMTWKRSVTEVFFDKRSTDSVCLKGPMGNLGTQATPLVPLWSCGGQLPSYVFHHENHLGPNTASWMYEGGSHKMRYLS